MDNTAAGAETNREPHPDDEEASLTDRRLAGLRCFVIMPYGRKTDPATGTPIEFDTVYEKIIEPAVQSQGLECIRSDKVSESGLIQQEMIRHIIEADLAIVDITLANPNVMYELGVRHAAKKSGTIILRQAGSGIPFNIAGMRAMDYHAPTKEPVPETLEMDITRLSGHIRTALTQRGTDSMVHALIPGLNVSLPAKEIRKKQTFCYRFDDTARRICIITGDIVNVSDIDAWVNAENTRMEMGRLHDFSVSALIRYYGARRNARGHVVVDTIAKELRRKLGQNTLAGVEPGTVIPTGSGRLNDDNNVKLLLHVAAQHGEPSHGYSTVRGYVRCIYNVLYEVDRHNARKGGGRSGNLVRSVIFPLFGSRYSGINPSDLAYDMIEASVEFLKQEKSSKLERIAFLAYTTADLELLRTALQRNGLTETGE